MKTIIYMLSMIIFALIASCSQPTEIVRSPSIYGTVVDETGKPVADADVCVIPDVSRLFAFRDDYNPKNNKTLEINPFVLMSFEANVMFDNISLHWTTLSEINTDKFILERADIVNDVFGNFFAIDTLKAVGNSGSKREYFLADFKITTNSKYKYRLNLMDLDGSSKYSNELIVDSYNNSPKTISNFPNPFSSSTVISFKVNTPNPIKLEVIENSTGKVFLKEDNMTQSGQYQINWDAKNTETSDSTRSLRPGVYTAKLTVGDSAFTHNMILGFIFDIANCSIPLEVTKTDKDGKFVIPYNWFPDLQVATTVYPNGKILSNFDYGLKANIVVRRTVDNNPTSKTYLVYKNQILVDKSKVVDLNCTAKKIVIK